MKNSKTKLMVAMLAFLALGAAADDGIMPSAGGVPTSNGEASAESDGIAQANEPLQPASPTALDVSVLSAALNADGVLPAKCRLALQELEKSVTAANAAAVAQRAKIDELTKTYLKNGLEKAQAAGNLDKAIAFKNALGNADGEIVGDIEEIEKLRTGRETQLVRIAQGLITAGLNAARTFSAALDAQKKETTRRGELETAQKIASLQKLTEKWMADTQSKMPVATSTTAPSPQPRQSGDKLHSANSKENPATSSFQKGSVRTKPVEIPFPTFRNNLVLWYDFSDKASLDKEKTSVADKSGHGNSGRIVGAMWRTDDSGNGCFDFDGLPGLRNRVDQSPEDNHDFIRVQGNLGDFPLNDFTISVVCCPQNGGTIIGTAQNELWQREWCLTYNRFQWAWTPGRSSGAKGREIHTLSFDGAPGSIQHFVVKRSGTRTTVWRNGVKVAGTEAFPKQGLPIYSYGLFLGNMELDAASWRRWDCLKGSIYNAAIWKRALSDTETGTLCANMKRRFDIRDNR